MIEGDNGKISIVGMYGEDGGIIEFGAIQSIPEGQIVISDEPTMMKEYTKQGRVGLTIEQARELQEDIDQAIEWVEEIDDE